MRGQAGAPGAAIRAHEELFAYWASLRDGPKLPGRRAIGPEGMKRLLPTVSLIDVIDGDYRIRLAGTGLHTIYGREITGRRTAEIYAGGAAEYWRGELSRVVAQRRPAVGVHNLGWRGASHISLVWLRLPLASNGVDVDMILGYDAVVGPHNAASGIRAA
jgi:hypothetical protein